MDIVLEVTPPALVAAQLSALGTLKDTPAPLPVEAEGRYNVALKRELGIIRVSSSVCHHAHSSVYCLTSVSRFKFPL
jgi:hypothetical protein